MRCISSEINASPKAAFPTLTEVRGKGNVDIIKSHNTYGVGINPQICC